MLDQSKLIQALRRLGQLGLTHGLQIELSLYGGSAMILLYDLDRRTRDVDAVFRPREEVLPLARRVAEELSLPENWLSDDVRQFTAPVESRRTAPIEFEGLRVQVPTAKYLLAMKVRAAREPLPGYDGDRGDLAFLIRKMEIRSLDGLQSAVDRFFPDEVIPEAKREYLNSIIAEVWSDE